MFYDKFYIIYGLYNYKIDSPNPKVKRWILQDENFIPTPNDIFVWDYSLDDAVWDDNKFWTEGTN